MDSLGGHACPCRQVQFQIRWERNLDSSKLVLGNFRMSAMSNLALRVVLQCQQHVPTSSIDRNVHECLNGEFPPI